MCATYRYDGNNLFKKILPNKSTEEGIDCQEKQKLYKSELVLKPLDKVA